MEKRQSLQYVVPGKLDSHMPKNEIRALPGIIHKNKLKMDQRPNVKPDIIKNLEENRKSTL